MPLLIDDLRFAATDVRQRLQSRVELIQSGSRQALGLLQLYIALAGTTLSGSALILLSSANTLPRSLGFGLAGFSAATVIGAMSCLVVMWPGKIALAGREPAFWLTWADRDGVSSEEAFRTYIGSVEEALAINGKLNNRMAIAMLIGKCAGAAAPVLGLAAGAFAYLKHF